MKWSVTDDALLAWGTNRYAVLRGGGIEAGARIADSGTGTTTRTFSALIYTSMGAGIYGKYAKVEIVSSGSGQLRAGIIITNIHKLPFLLLKTLPGRFYALTDTPLHLYKSPSSRCISIPLSHASSLKFPLNPSSSAPLPSSSAAPVSRPVEQVLPSSSHFTALHPWCRS